MSDRQADAWWIIAVLLLIFALMALGSLAANADPLPDDIPQGWGHPNRGAPHFYSPRCCSAADCEPVGEDAITPTATGYQILFRSSRGHLVAGTVRYGSDKVHPTQDERQHVCSSPYSIYCIYVRFGS